MPTVRPSRPLIFLELKRFGVVSSDWKWILLVSLAAYLAPMMLGLSAWGVPLVIFTCPAALGASVVVSNILHKNRPPQWVEHQLRSKFLRLHCRFHGRRPAIRAALPGADFIPVEQRSAEPGGRVTIPEAAYPPPPGPQPPREGFTPPCGENDSIGFVPTHSWSGPGAGPAWAGEKE